MTAELIARALEGRRSGRGWMAKCPAHQDRGPSLSICERDGKPLLHCFGGCPQAAVIEALRAMGLWPRQTRLNRTPAARRAWGLAQRDLERALPVARQWRAAAIALGEQVLVDLKSAQVDPMLPRPGVGEIERWTHLLARWERLAGAELVAEYREWSEIEPDLTAAMVCAARMTELADKRALSRFLEAMDPWAAA